MAIVGVIKQFASYTHRRTDMKNDGNLVFLYLHIIHTDVLSNTDLIKDIDPVHVVKIISDIKYKLLIHLTSSVKLCSFYFLLKSCLIDLMGSICSIVFILDLINIIILVNFVNILNLVNMINLINNYFLFSLNNIINFDNNINNNFKYQYNG